MVIHLKVVCPYRSLYNENYKEPRIYVVGHMAHCHWPDTSAQCQFFGIGYYHGSRCRCSWRLDHRGSITRYSEPIRQDRNRSGLSWSVRNAVHLTVRGELVEPPAAYPEPFDKFRANGISLSEQHWVQPGLFLSQSGSIFNLPISPYRRSGSLYSFTALGPRFAFK